MCASCASAARLAAAAALLASCNASQAVCLLAAWLADFRPFFAAKSNAKKVYRPAANATLLYGHAVTLVGYNNEEQWWLALNSWGPEFADGGMFRVRGLAAEVIGLIRLGGVSLIFACHTPRRWPLTPARCSWLAGGRPTA